MATFYVKTGNLRDISGKISNLNNKAKNIENRFTTIRYSLDYDVKRRNGIDYTLREIDSQLDSICRGLQSLGIYLQNAANGYQRLEDRVKEQTNTLTKSGATWMSYIPKGIAKYIPKDWTKVFIGIGIFGEGMKLVTDTSKVKDFINKSNIIVTNKNTFDKVTDAIGKAAKVVSDIASTGLTTLKSKMKGLFESTKANNTPAPTPAPQKPIVTDEAKFTRYLSHNPGVDDPDVRKLQQRLIDLGYGPLDVDGRFGNQTLAAVNRFKDGAMPEGNKDNNRGVVGPYTWEVLFAAGALKASEIKSETKIDPSFETTGNADIDKLLGIALSQKGIMESSTNPNVKYNNLVKYNDWYYGRQVEGNDKYPWCAVFVSWCANEAGIMKTTIPRYASCYEGIKFYKNKENFHLAGGEYVPKAGDVFFNSSDKYPNGGAHTGIVVAYDSKNKFVYTVEGNADQGVRVLRRNLSEIYGFGSNGGTSSGTVPAEFGAKSRGTQ